MKIKRGKNFKKNIFYWVVVFLVFINFIVFLFFGRFYGFAVFEATSQADFDEGIYDGTEYSDEGVRLISGQDSGTYTSKVFDAGADATWNNLSWIIDTPFWGICSGIVTSCDSLEENDCEVQLGCSWSPASCVNTGSCDSCSKKNKCNNCEGCEWIKKQTSCEGILDCSIYDDEDDCEDCKQCLWNENEEEDDDEDDDNGDDEDEDDDSEICENDGDCSSCSKKGKCNKCNGCSWVEIPKHCEGSLDCSGYGETECSSCEQCSWVASNCSGIVSSCDLLEENDCEEQLDCSWTSYETSLNLKVRSCDDASCSGENWVDISDTSPQDLDLNNRYFQFEFEFETNDLSYTPKLSSITLDYDLECEENWEFQYTACNSSDVKIKYYLDGNSCGIINDLPADNGTIESCDYIISTEFSGSTTDFLSINLSNVSNACLEDPGYGLINFSENISIEKSVDLDSNVIIEDNLIFLNSTALPQFNKSAILTFYNLSWDSPQILKNGEVCSDCSVISYDSTTGTFVFSITGFSTYTTRETPTSSGSSGSGGGGGGGGGRSSTIISPSPSLSEETTAETEEALFDVIVSTLPGSEEIFPEAREVSFQVDLIKFRLPEELTKVEISYKVSKEEEIIYEENEDLEVQKEISFIKSLALPELDLGTYQIDVKIKYDNKTAEGKTSFVVREKTEGGLLDFLKSRIYLFVGVLVVLIVSLIYFFKFKKRKALNLKNLFKLKFRRKRK